MQEKGRERERERIPSRLCTVSMDPDVELEVINRETMTWAKVEHLTESPRCPNIFRLLKNFA